MATTIRLTAESAFGKSGQYIARLTGRAPQVQFQRSFCGSKYGKRNENTSYETDEIGLYETCDVGKRGKDKSYYLVLPWGDGLCKLTSDLEDALIIAKRLGEGETLEDVVAVERGDVVIERTYPRICKACGATCAAWTCECGSTDVSQETMERPKLGADGNELHHLLYVLRNKVEIKQAHAALSHEIAVETIVVALQDMSGEQQRKVLKAVRERLAPPKKSAEPANEPAKESA